MKISEKGLDLIKEFEELRLKPYLCPANKPTIGYGMTRYPDGTKVTMQDAPITAEKADADFRILVAEFEQYVRGYLKRELNQNQYDAVVSFSYNVGIGGFRGSTLLKRINNNPCDPDIAYQFSRWNKAGKRVLRGLTKRRKMESNLYFS